MATRQKSPTPPPVANGHDADPELDKGNEPEIVIDGEAATEVDARPAAAAEVDPGVKTLKEQLAASESRRIAAEADRDRIAAERGKDQQVLTDSRLLVIESTIQTNETKKVDILRRMKDAKEAGDYDAETNAAAELAEVTLDLKQAKLGKDRLENEIEEAKTAPKVEGDRFQQWVKENNVHPRSEAWLRDHMDYLEDPEKNAELTLAHTRAIKAGNKPNSDGYFAAIEAELGMGDETETEQPAAEERRAAAPAAPVGRGGQIGGQRQASAVPGITILGPGKYRVTKEIAEAAQMTGVTVKQYVEEALKLQRGPDGQLH